MIPDGHSEPVAETLKVVSGVGRVGEPVTTVEVADGLGVSRRRAYDRLEALVDQDLLATKKVGARGRVWWRPRTTDDETQRGSWPWSGGLADAACAELVGATGSGVVLVTDAGGVAWVDPTVARWFGIDSEDAVGSDARDLLDTVTDRVDDPAPLHDALDDAGVPGDSVEFAYRSPDGTRRRFELCGRRIDGRGDAEWRAWVFEDVTAQGQAGSREEHDRRDALDVTTLETVLDAVPVATAVFDEEGTVEMANDAAVGVLGVPEDGDHASFQEGDVLDADGDPLALEETPVGETLATGDGVHERELQDDDPDGEQRWYTVTTLPVANEDGAVERVVGCVEDVTRLKAQTRYLERGRGELQRELEEVLDRIEDGFYGLDEDCRFTYVNDTAAELLDVEPSSVLGRDAREVLEMTDDFRTALERAIDDQEFVALEDYYEPLDAWFENTVHPSETGVSVYFRDVSERVERERELEEAKRRYRAVVENYPQGLVALFDADLRYSLVGGDIEEAYGVDPDALEGSRVGSVMPDVAARERLEARYRGALEGEPSAFELEWDDYVFEMQVVPITDDDGDPFAGMVISRDVTAEREHRHELEAQRDRLAALDDLNAVFQDVTEAVVDQSTRDEIESVVCRRIAESTSYEFAWIGEPDSTSREIDLQTEAGVEGYLEDVTLAIDPDDPGRLGPAARALKRGETQTIDDATEEFVPPEWQAHARAYGYRSMAAIPIVHQDAVYGVLCVYAARAGAFQSEERAVVDKLGEVVGHAIAAAQRKQALMSDEVVELEFHIANVLETAGADVDVGGEVTLDQVVPANEDTYLLFGTVTEEAIDVPGTLVDALPHWEDATVREASGGTARFEATLVEPPVISAVASRAGSVEAATIEDGDYRVRLHLPPSVELRPVIDAVRETFPSAQLVTRRQVTREGADGNRPDSVVTEELTERQRAALEAALYGGYFEWPRESTGEDVAASLGVSPPTFHQHLRRAQREVVGAVFGVRD